MAWFMAQHSCVHLVTKMAIDFIDIHSCVMDRRIEVCHIHTHAGPYLSFVNGLTAFFLTIEI